MATLDSSPSKISGLSWSQFAEAMKDNTKDGKEDETSSKPTRRLSASLMLSKEDKWLYGFCPAQDEFYLVVCEACGQVVKPAALRSHIEQRHANMNSTFPNTPVKADTRSSRNASKADQRKKPSSVSSKSSTQSKSKNSNCAADTETPCDKSKKDVIADHDPPKLTVAQDRQEKGPPAKYEIQEMDGSDSKEVILSIPSPEIHSQDDFTSILISPVPSPSTSVQQVIVTTVHSSTLAINNSALTTISSQHSQHHKSAVSAALTSISAALDPTKPQCSSLPMKPSQLSNKCLPSSASSPSSCVKSSRKKSKQKDDKFIPCALREYDSDRHCGVLNADTKSSCTRSLTCKTHALSLRRAVPGRSKSFDILLKERKDAKEAILKAKGKLFPTTPTTPGQKPAPCLISPDMPSPSPLFPPARIPSAPSVIQRPLAKLGPAASARIPPLPFNRPSSIPVFPSASPLLPVLIGDEVISSEEEEDTEDDCFISHAPRPLAVNSFGCWRQGRGNYVFNRREDRVRSALAAALDRQLHPPPPKKLCVESSIPKAGAVSSSDPYDFGPSSDSNRSHNKSTPSNGINSSSGHKAKTKANHLRTKSKSKFKSRDKEMTNGQDGLSSDDLPSPGLTSPQSCDGLTSPICNGLNYLSRDVLSSSIPSPSLELPDQIFAGDSDQKPVKGQKSSQRSYSTSTAQQLAAAALNLSPHLGQELCGIYTAPKLSPAPAFTFQQKTANNKGAMQPLSLAIVAPGNMTTQKSLRQGGDSRLKPRDITSQVQNSPSNVFS